MSTCTFFGHRDCPDSIKPKLRETLVDLIEHHAVNLFYVGQQGAFDRMVHSLLRELVLLYPHINYAVVLERMPPQRDDFDPRDYSDTMLPEGIETVHSRFVVSWRNRWMLSQSDYVVTYITHSWGGAAQFAKTAQKQKKNSPESCRDTSTQQIEKPDTLTDVWFLVEISGIEPPRA